MCRVKATGRERGLVAYAWVGAGKPIHNKRDFPIKLAQEMGNGGRMGEGSTWVQLMGGGGGG